MSRIKVLVVDDSAVVRQVLVSILEADPGIEVIGAAVDPVAAVEKLRVDWPDVLVLDVEMPRMDGISFLRKIMAERPTPTVICSTLAEAGAQTTLDALAAGAVAIVTKPKLGLGQFLQEAGAELVATIKAAATANVRRAPSTPILRPRVSPGAMSRTTDQIVAIGASTGGTQALESIFQSLPLVCPGIVVVQHMPQSFTAAFAERLDRICELTVKEATHGARVLPGQALIAPGGRHMILKRSGAHYHVEVVDGPPVRRHRPSVDVLFRSVAQSAGANALGILLTGMGDDGAAGLLDLRKAGGRTIAQDEATCVVYGMPKEAVRRGAAERSLPLDDVPEAILEELRRS